MHQRTRILLMSLVLAAAAGPAQAHLCIIRQGPESRGTPQAGDRMGQALAAGDFNNDGFDDLAMGLPDKDIGGVADAGAVYIEWGGFFGLDPAGASYWNEDAANGGSGNFPGAQFGYALAAADFNADGFCDLAVGAPGSSLLVGADAGVVYILLGSATGMNRFADLSQADAGSNVEAGDRFGSSFAVGNFDGDSKPYPDLAVGSPGENNAQGAVFYFLSNGLGPLGPNGFFTQADFGQVPVDGDQFGFALAAGNLLSGVEDDLAMAAPFRQVGVDIRAGAVYFSPGTSGGLGIGGYPALTALSAGFTSTDARFGYALAAGKLMDTGGTYECLAVGEPWRDYVPGAGGPTPVQKAGRAIVYKGSLTGVLTTGEVVLTQANAGGTIGAWDQFGAALASGYFWDVNDGWEDLAVGSTGDNLGFTSFAGQFNILPGGVNGPGSNGWLGFNQGTLNEAIEPDDTLGYSPVFGQFDGTGNGHAAVGAPGEDNESGMVHIVAPWRQTYGLSCRNSVVYDCDNNLIFSQKPYDQVLLASVTKIITILIACERIQNGTILASDEYIVPNWVADQIGGSQVPLQRGEKMNFFDMMNLCLHLSGNDAAHALADWMHGSQGPNVSVPAFVNEMNQRAQQIGMVNTQFNNPNGFENEAVGPDTGFGNFSTSVDMALLCQVAMANPLFFGVANQTQYTMTRQYADPNNPGQFVLAGPWTITTFYASIIQSLIQPAVGIKGGLTTAAQTTGCFAAQNTDGDVWVAGSYFTPQNSPNFNLDAANLLALSAPSCAVDVEVVGIPNPNQPPRWDNVPTLAGTNSGGASQIGLAGPGDVAVEVAPWTGGGSNDSCIELARASSSTIPFGQEMQYGIGPFQGHGDISILNTGNSDAALQIQTSMGEELGFSIAPGEVAIVPAFEPASQIADYSMLIMNVDAAGSDAEISVEELYGFDVNFAGAFQHFTAILKRGETSEPDVFYFNVKGKSVPKQPGSDPTIYMTVHDSDDVSTGVEDPILSLPTNTLLELRSAYPNPFSLQTQIRFSLHAGAEVSIGIYDARGRRVREYETKELGAGQHLLMWDGRDARGMRASTGSYFYRVVVNGHPAGSGKLIVVR